jgi:hypothetical protein
MRISPRSGAAGSGIVRLWRFALATLALGSTWAATSEPKPCPIIDAIAPLSVVASRTAGEPEATQIAAYKQALIAPHPGLYAEGVLGLKQGPAMDQLILASLAQARKAPDREALKARVRQQVAATSLAFHQVFPDFRCNFPVYMTDSLGVLDGAGRIVDGRPAMVLGIGSIEIEESHLSLAVFFNHEFFHRYHFQAAGFSDDAAGNETIWRALWTEGLATYISRVLTPGATLAEALLSKKLAERAQPLMPRMAADLLAGMDRVEPELFNTYFTSGPTAEKHSLPARAGYYVGYVVAERLAQRHSLDQLAHLKGTKLHDEIGNALRVLASSGAEAGPTS